MWSIGTFIKMNQYCLVEWNDLEVYYVHLRLSLSMHPLPRAPLPERSKMIWMYILI